MYIPLDSITGKQVVLPAITGWESWTPTGSWTTNTTYTGKRKQDANDVLLKYKIALTGVPGGTSLLTLDLPPDLTLDTSQISAAGMPVGVAYIRDGGTQTYIGVVVLNATSGNQDVFYITTNGSGTTGAITFAVPFTFGNSDLIEIDIRVPVTEYAGGYQAYGAGLVLGNRSGLIKARTPLTALTVTGTNWTTLRARGYAYEDNNGVWKLNFNITGSISPTASTFVGAITGVVFKNVAELRQPFTVYLREMGVSARQAVDNFVSNNTNTFHIASVGGVFNQVNISGDLELESKPSWA